MICLFILGKLQFSCFPPICTLQVQKNITFFGTSTSKHSSMFQIPVLQCLWMLVWFQKIFCAIQKLQMILIETDM